MKLVEHMVEKPVPLDGIAGENAISLQKLKWEAQVLR
jgi:hypothetical protein